MSSFLENIVENTLEKYSTEEISNLCFVLPNRRAGLFLKKHLSHKLQKTIWSPSIFSIEDFVCHITGLEIADQTTLLFELFQVYKNSEKDKAQHFEDFINWAGVLINDYNDSDLNLADTEKLFQYLNEAKAISLWDPDHISLTEHEKNYLSFYHSLGKYYIDFTKLLLDKNCGYQGLVYKKAAEQLQYLIKNVKFSKIIFAGFNALTRSEEKIIKALLEEGKADIFWDADHYYISNEIFEAGDFIRRYTKEWGLKEHNWIDDHFRSSEKNIHITGVPLNIGQSELAGQILSEMSDPEANSEKTAIVLADESLLIPVLYTIPENVKDLNITMGYPLSCSTVHSLFMNIFTLHENSMRYSSKNVRRFFQKDILNLFNHPYFRIIAEDELQLLLEKIKRSNRIFYTSEEIIKQFKTAVISALFDSMAEPAHLLERFTALIDVIKDRLIGGKYHDKTHSDIDLEYLFHYAVVINKVRNLISEYGDIKDIRTLRKIFTTLAESSSIPFYGEPLKGLQLMGMLETRALDFDNIILLSANENILPSGKFHSTFIPYDIRKEMGLSTYRQKESIFAYHFYRLLQRGKNIHIIYNTEPDRLGSGEKSRFITQICEELPKYNDNIKIHQSLMLQDTSLSQKNENISITKTREILNDIGTFAAKGFSPSALNTFIACPLRFYLQYIQKIEEAEETEDTIDAATLGSVIHSVLQELYSGFKGKMIRPEHIRKMPGQVEMLVNKGFGKYYPGGDISTGKNLLIAKVASKFINNFLHAEIAFTEELEKNKKQLCIVDLEEFADASINIETEDHKTIAVRIHGFIDRIDQLGETLRIIDYKTGVVKKEELKFSEWEELLHEPVLSKSLQLLIYAYLCNKKYSLNDLSAGIITFRNLSKGFLPVEYPGCETNIISPEALKKTEEIILTLVSTIFRKDIPFTQTDDTAICQNCPFTSICNR
jgi:ATP-dependent helicase/nuclease subunit B